MTAYSPIWRLAEMVPGDPAVKNSWGTVQTATVPLLEQGAVGVLDVSVNGLTTYTLSTANNAADEARYLTQNYTGAITGNCTVTIPNVARVGWAKNSTTGSHNVLLTSGAGTQATIAPGGSWFFYWCDGAGNVALVPVGLGGLALAGNLSVAGTAAVTGTITAANGTSGSQVVNFNQFSPTASFAGHVYLPGGVTIQWGNESSTGNQTITYNVAFSGVPWAVIPSVKDAPGGVSPGATGCSVLASPTSTQAVIATFDTSTGFVKAANFFWIAIGPT